MLQPADALSNRYENTSNLCMELCSESAAPIALRATRTSPGHAVAIMGAAGGVGHRAGKLAKRVFGVQIIGVDRWWKLDAMLSRRADKVTNVFLLMPEEYSGKEGFNYGESRNMLLQGCIWLRSGSRAPRYAESSL